MNCAASAAHAVILMLWTSDCRAGDYRQLLYPARWGRSRLLPNRLRRRAAWCDWFGWRWSRACVWFGLCRFTDGVWHGLVPAWPVCSVSGWSLAVVFGYAKKGGGTLWCPLPVRFGCGGVLLSHTLPGAVPSPCQVLASGFGMGPGVSPGPWPPQILIIHPTGNACACSRGGLCGGLGTG